MKTERQRRKRRFNGELELVRTVRGRDRVRDRERRQDQYFRKRYSISIQHTIHVCVGKSMRVETISYVLDIAN